MYLYFVSYSHRHNYLGNVVIRWDKPITTVEDIDRLTKFISNIYKSSDTVVILNFQLLRKEKVSKKHRNKH